MLRSCIWLKGARYMGEIYVNENDIKFLRKYPNGVCTIRPIEYFRIVQCADEVGGMYITKELSKTADSKIVDSSQTDKFDEWVNELNESGYYKVDPDDLPEYDENEEVA